MAKVLPFQCKKTLELVTVKARTCELEMVMGNVWISWQQELMEMVLENVWISWEQELLRMERTLEQETVKTRTSELEMEMVMEQIWICLKQELMEMEMVHEKVLNEGEWWQQKQLQPPSALLHSDQGIHIDSSRNLSLTG